jgi:hypothetical protein
MEQQLREAAMARLAAEGKSRDATVERNLFEKLHRETRAEHVRDLRDIADHTAQRNGGRSIFSAHANVTAEEAPELEPIDPVRPRGAAEKWVGVEDFYAQVRRQNASPHLSTPMQTLGDLDLETPDTQ